MADEKVDVGPELVTREVKPWSLTVARYLEHLLAQGVGGIPRPERAEEGLESVTFIDGESMGSQVFTDGQLHGLGVLLRRIHDAGFSPADPNRDVWQPFEFRAEANAEGVRNTQQIQLNDIVYGHGDTGPWNVIKTPHGDIALIDWEFAGPIVRGDEVAATAWLNVRFHDPDVDPTSSRSSLCDKVRGLAAFLSGYGVLSSDWPSIVSRMSDYAIRDAAYEATRLSISPTPGPQEPQNAAWRLAWRSRSAAWLVRNRETVLQQLHDLTAGPPNIG